MSLALARYLDRALVAHRQSFLFSDARLTETIWLSAIILAHIFWLLTHRFQPDQPYELPFHGWTTTTGISLLFFKHEPVLRSLGYFWPRTMEPPQRTPVDGLSVESQLQLMDLDKDLTALFERSNAPLFAKSRQKVYEEARIYVYYLYGSYYNGESSETLRACTSTMPLRCQPDFWKLLSAHDPLAMALLARSMVLLKGLDYVWWMNGYGDYEVLARDIKGICSLMPDELQWMMEWPRRVLCGEIMVSRPGLYPPQGGFTLHS